MSDNIIIKKVHYCAGPFAVTECGVNVVFKRANWSPEFVNCVKCMESRNYIEDMAAIAENKS